MQEMGRMSRSELCLLLQVGDWTSVSCVGGCHCVQGLLASRTLPNNAAWSLCKLCYYLTFFKSKQDDFLHLSRNRHLYLRSRASKVGMLHRTWWLLTLALQGKLYRALQPKLYATRNLCMHDFLKLHHNWEGTKKYVFNYIWATGKRLASLLHNIDIAVVSESVGSLFMWKLTDRRKMGVIRKIWNRKWDVHSCP